MIKVSRRLGPATAGLLTVALFFSQVVAFGARAQEPSGVKAETVPNAKAVTRKAKKRKKKKSASSTPLVPIPIPLYAMPTVRVEPPPQSMVTTAPAPQPPITAKGSNRAARTPGIHVGPVVIKPVGVPSFSASNGSAIVIDSVNPDDPEPAPAVPFSSDIEVLGLVGNVTSVSVTINSLSHTSPDDLDMLLVSPNGRSFHFWSDVGGTSPTEGTTVTVSDTGNTVLPDDGPLVNGTTYRPFNNDTEGDTFPLPAPGPPYGEPLLAGGDTFASVYAGMTGDQANGTWSLFVTDDTNGNGGSIAEGWTLNITTQLAPTTAGQLIISEFRTSGPLGPADEYVELYNTTPGPLTVQASDGSNGLGVFSSDGILRCTIPNETVIPVRGHYLCVNETNQDARRGKVHPNGVAKGDIPNNIGIALFSTTNGGPANLTVQNRLDAVGPTTEENPVFKEGNGYPPLTINNLDYAFFRDLRNGGIPQDTGDNATDFLFVDTNGTSAGAGQRLGAPSPEGLSDPRTANDSVLTSLIAPCTGAPDPPNRVRDFTSDPGNNSTFGTMSVRRAFTNTTETPITRLRFKVINVTTFPAPSGVADLRLRTSESSTEADPCAEKGTINLAGLTLEQPPSQPNGGGFNSNVSANTVNLETPLQPGETIFVNFLFGIQQTGTFRIFVNIEALP
ncbi:MAG TPA: hypothetical protein VI306_13250 [Pyrinomonadaceae bacterium]